MLTIALIATVATLAVGSSGERDAAAQAGSAAPPLVDCKTRIQVAGDASPGPKSAKVGPVVFNRLKAWRKVKEIDPGARRWVPIKTPFFIKAGKPPATVIVDEHVVPPRARVTVGLDEGGAATGQAVTIAACATPAKHRWTVFLAGFEVKGPTCMRLSVQVEGQPQPVGPRKVPIGKGSCR